MDGSGARRVRFNIEQFEKVVPEPPPLFLFPGIVPLEERDDELSAWLKNLTNSFSACLHGGVVISRELCVTEGVVIQFARSAKPCSQSSSK